MTASACQSILCPTDFSEASIAAFAQALRIAIGARSQLHLLNVARHTALDRAPLPFPRVRDTLIKWGMLSPGAPKGAIGQDLGLRVALAQVEGYDVSRRAASCAKTHSCDLIVMMTHARTGVSRWMYGSIASETARRSRLPTLNLRRGSNGFVDPATGSATLKRALIPVDPAIPPLAARRLVETLALALQSPVEIRLLSMGRSLDLGDDWPPVKMRSGPIVDAIVDYANEIAAALIVMPTAGRRGLFDALSGSTTERVLIGADRPVLAVPTSEI
jgi:nucleotide-binding universal stress UspA family protein